MSVIVILKDLGEYQENIDKYCFFRLKVIFFEGPVHGYFYVCPLLFS